MSVLVADDFAEPVTTDFFLADPFYGDTLNAFSFRAAQGQPEGTRLFSPTGRWLGAFCDGTLAFVPEGGPAVSIPGLVQQALNELDPPEPALAVTPDHGRHVVQMPSWMAVDPTYWHAEREATATAGRVQVTATLDPFQTVWDLGNGETIDCPNPGTVWSAGMSEDQSDCSYTYEYPSIDPPDNTFDIAGTVRFDVAVITNAPGTYGPFVPVERTTTDTIEVVEIQAVGR